MWSPHDCRGASRIFSKLLLLVSVWLLFVGAVQGHGVFVVEPVVSAQGTINASCDGILLSDHQCIFAGFGYGETGYVNDRLSYLNLSDPEPVWVPIPGSERSSVAAAGAFLLIEERMIGVFGGSDGSSLFNDLHLFYLNDSSPWLHKNTTNPPPAMAGMTDFIRISPSELVMFGGRTATGFSSSLWILNTELWSWRELTAAGEQTPPGMEGAQLVLFDDSLWLYGGRSCQTVSPACWHNTLWVSPLPLTLSNTTSWNVFATEWQPTPRAFHSMTQYLDGIVLLFGATYDPLHPEYVLGDAAMFEEHHADWVRFDTYGQIQARKGHRAVTVNDSLYSFGGCVPPSTYYGETVRIVERPKVTANNFRIMNPDLKNVIGGLNILYLQATEATLVGDEGAEEVTWGAPLNWVTADAVDHLSADLVFGAPLNISTYLLPMPLSVRSVGEGLFAIPFYYPFRPSFEIKFDNETIPQSGLTLGVVPSPLSVASQLSVLNLFVHKHDAYDAAWGKRAELRLDGYDRFTNPIYMGNETDRFVVSLTEEDAGEEAPSLAMLPIVDLENGSYLICFIVPEAEKTFVLSVWVEGEDVVGSPVYIDAIYPFDVSLAYRLSAALCCMLGFLVSCWVARLLWLHRSARKVQAIGPSYLATMIGGGGATMVVFAFLFGSRYHPCELWMWVHHLAWLFVYYPLILKTWRLRRIFEAATRNDPANPNQPPSGTERISNRMIAFIFLGLLSIVLIYLSLWSALDPYERVWEPSSRSPVVTVPTCKSKSLVWGVVTVSWTIITLGLCAWLSVASRAVPHLFNESRQIALVVYNSTLAVTLYFILYLVVGAENPATYSLLPSLCFCWLFVTPPIICLTPRIRSLSPRRRKSHSSSQEVNAIEFRKMIHRLKLKDLENKQLHAELVRLHALVGGDTEDSFLGQQEHRRSSSRAVQQRMDSRPVSRSQAVTRGADQNKVFHSLAESEARRISRSKASVSAATEIHDVLQDHKSITTAVTTMGLSSSLPSFDPDLSRIRPAGDQGDDHFRSSSAGEAIPSSRSTLPPRWRRSAIEFKSSSSSGSSRTVPRPRSLSQGHSDPDPALLSLGDINTRVL